MYCAQPLWEFKEKTKITKKIKPKTKQQQQQEHLQHTLTTCIVRIHIRASNKCQR